MKRLALIVALAMAAVAAPQAASPPSANKHGNACVFISSVGQYRLLDRDKIVIWAPGRRDTYLVELSMPLFGLEGSWQMAMIDNDRDGRLCGFSMDRIGVRDFGRPESSSIRSMSRLTDEELGALEQQYNVQLRRQAKNSGPAEAE
jgi:hypothetical protein